MKKYIFLLSLALIFLLVTSGCGVKGPMPPAGVLFTKVTAPESASTLALRTGNLDKVGTSKRGEASATAILGIISTGDAGIQAAMVDGGISQIHHVDYETTIIIYGLVHSLKTIVYGE